MVRIFLLNWNRSLTALSGSDFAEPEPEPCGFEWFGFSLNRNQSHLALSGSDFAEPEPEPCGFEWFGFNFVSPQILI
jgi:hypothetical protein